MRTLIITVAGTASRFNRDTEEPTLKCLYEIGGSNYTLLYQILDKARDFDEFVIVGGYLFEKLEYFADTNLHEFKNRLKLVYNPEYSTFGSGYSLILGIQNVNPKTQEIIFVEGDLYFNESDFKKIKNSKKNVFTVNRDLITAKKAVVVYENKDHHLRYLYDTSHSYLNISEDFIAVYNSGQVWKFQDLEKLSRTLENLSPQQVKSTNLEIIQEYFGNLTASEYEMVVFETWYNCNTVQDYKTVYSKITKEIII